MKILASILIFILPILSFSQDDCPCCGEEYQAFDFWLGEWEVYQNDQLAGVNTIEKIKDNCIIREDYSASNSPYTGTSYNYYNAAAGYWEQIWIDNQGFVLHMKGNSLDGNMVLSTDPMKNPQGETVVHRITWTPNKDKTVRQHWEVHNKDQRKWSTVFDGLYKPK